MLFQSKPTAILYLRRQDAVLIMPSGSTSLDLSQELVQNLEVQDSSKLAGLVAGFLESQRCKDQQILLVLDNDIVFQKNLPSIAKAEDTTAALKNFESKLPFDPKNRQLITVKQKDQVQLFGINKAFYLAIVQGIQKANKIKAVVPAAVYGLSEDRKVDSQVVSSFLHETGPLKTSNFLVT